MNPTQLAILLAVLPGAVAVAGSEQPPPGPPWQRDLAVAQQEAIEQGKAIFVYLTKTH